MSFIFWTHKSVIFVKWCNFIFFFLQELGHILPCLSPPIYLPAGNQPIRERHPYCHRYCWMLHHESSSHREIWLWRRSDPLVYEERSFSSHRQTERFSRAVVIIAGSNQLQRPALTGLYCRREQSASSSYRDDGIHNVQNEGASYYYQEFIFKHVPLVLLAQNFQVNIDVYSKT